MNQKSFQNTRRNVGSGSILLLLTSGGICHNLEGGLRMHSLHTRQSERQSCPVFSCFLQRFRIFRTGIMFIRNLCRSRSFGHDKPKPGGQNFCHPIFYVLYNSRAGLFLIEVRAQGMKNPLNNPTN